MLLYKVTHELSEVIIEVYYTVLWTSVTVILAKGTVLLSYYKIMTEVGDLK